jgi:hypothetical protein
MTICHHCRQPVLLTTDRGWVHAEGGTYAMYCPVCAWHGAPYPAPWRCPSCGSEKVRDDHHVRPDLSGVAS